MDANPAEAPPRLDGSAKTRGEPKVCPIRRQEPDHPRHCTRATLNPPYPAHLDVFNVIRVYDINTRTEQELAEVIAHCLSLFPRLGGRKEAASVRPAGLCLHRYGPGFFAELVGFPAREEILTWFHTKWNLSKATVCEVTPPQVCTENCLW